MRTLTPLEEIHVPPTQPDQEYKIELFNRSFRFESLKRLLGAADFTKAGDRGAGLAAASEPEREAARAILSSLTLQEIYDQPLKDDSGEIDTVMRVNYDIDRDRFSSMSTMTLGELKDVLLRETGEAVNSLGFGLTGVMAAAVAKLMDTHELVYAARKLQRPSRARTHLGQPGTLSSRLQPNHPVDDPRGIALLCYAGLSMGGGDALIGVNPAVDTVENISSLLHHLDKLRRRTGAPTQICVLAHLKTQLACLEQGVPVEIIFQSLAGTEATNLSEFDISVDLLDHAYRTMFESSPLKDEAENLMYFETGQGSEYTYGKHYGIDMATTEALCYGLARRYRPYMVNNVTGFIGPETHLDDFEMIISNLQDHFMGKLLGLPMGMAPCYTLHSKITLEGQQMATQLLSTAGANYYMDVYLNNDRMLAYFDTSAHDDQTLRELHDRRPTPEFLEWALQREIFVETSGGRIERGPRWGDPRMFCESDAEFDELCRATPAMYGYENSGPRPADAVSRRLKSNLAWAREAIYSEVDMDQLRAIDDFRELSTNAGDKESHLNSPTLGSEVADGDGQELQPENYDVQIVVSDGLSAKAVNANMAELYPVLVDGLDGHELSRGRPIVARYGRVKLAESLAERLQTRLTIMLIGERPGGDAEAASSLSAYLAYQLLGEEEQREAATLSGNPDIRFEYTVISNIYSRGLPPVEAGSVVVEKAWQILSNRAAGNRLEALLKASC